MTKLNYNGYTIKLDLYTMLYKLIYNGKLVYESEYLQILVDEINDILSEKFYLNIKDNTIYNDSI